MVHIARLSPWRQAQERVVCWELCRPIKCKQFRASTWAHDDTAISQIRTSSPAEDILFSARAGQRDQSTAELCRACESAEDAADSQQHARASHRSNSTLGAWLWVAAWRTRTCGRLRVDSADKETRLLSGTACNCGSRPRQSSLSPHLTRIAIGDNLHHRCDDRLKFRQMAIISCRPRQDQLPTVVS